MRWWGHVWQNQFSDVFITIRQMAAVQKLVVYLDYVDTEIVKNGILLKFNCLKLYIFSENGVNTPRIMAGTHSFALGQRVAWRPRSVLR